MKTKKFLFASLLSISFFIGCSTNEKVDDTALSQTILAEDAIAESEIDASVDDISFISEDQFLVQQSLISKTSSTVKSILPICATITTVFANDIFTRTVDFGTAGCTLQNGNVVKGKIIISFSKTATTSARTISYSLVGFYHNEKLFEGNKTIIREIKSTTLLSAVHPVTSHTTDMKITFADGKIYTRTGTRVRETTEGFNTPSDLEDNVFLITGSNITVFPNGNKHISTIKTPLKIVMSCKKPFPVSGVITIVKNTKEAAIDFGNGDCDVLATITINGVSKEIKLRN